MSETGYALGKMPEPQNGEEVKECLRHSREALRKAFSDLFGRTTFDFALEYIQQLERERDAAVEAQPKWISVEERLPEKSGRYLINLGNGWVEECWFDHLEERWEEEHGDYSEDVTESVTHWMPLPKAPKEET